MFCWDPVRQVKTQHENVKFWNWVPKTIHKKSVFFFNHSTLVNNHDKKMGFLKMLIDMFDDSYSEICWSVYEG